MNSENPVPENKAAPDARRESNELPSHSELEGPLTSARSQSPTHAHCQTTCKTEKDWWDKIKPFLEMAGVVLLAIYTGYTIKMYSANKKAADAAKSAAETAHDALEDARKNFLAEQRPIIWLTNDIGEPRVVVNPKDHRMGQIIWTWHFTNYGKTPVDELRFRQYMQLGDRTLALSSGEKDVDVGAPVPPGKTDFDTVISEPMKQAEIVRFFNSGGVGIRIVLEYTDAYQSRYETGICLSRTNAGSITYCHEGNYIK